MSLESNEQAVSSVTLGAQHVANLMGMGFSRDEAEEMLLSQNIPQVTAPVEANPSRRARPRVQGPLPAGAADELIQLQQDQRESGRNENVLNVAEDIQYGNDQADFQNAVGDDKNIIGREARRRQQQVKDAGDIDIKVNMELGNGRRNLVEGVARAGQPVPDDLKEAMMLQEQGLAFVPNDKKQFFRNGRNKGKERIVRRGGGLGPEAPFKAPVAGQGAGAQDALLRIEAALANGELQLDDVVNAGQFQPGRRLESAFDTAPSSGAGAAVANQGKTVGELLESLRGAQNPGKAQFRRDNANAARVAGGKSLSQAENEVGAVARQILEEQNANGNAGRRLFNKDQMYDMKENPQVGIDNIGGRGPIDARRMPVDAMANAEAEARRRLGVDISDAEQIKRAVFQADDNELVNRMLQQKQVRKNGPANPMTSPDIGRIVEVYGDQGDVEIFDDGGYAAVKEAAGDYGAGLDDRNIAELGVAKGVDKKGAIQRIVMAPNIERPDAVPLMRNGKRVAHFGDIGGRLVELGVIDDGNASSQQLGRGQAWAAANIRPMGREGGNQFGPNAIDIVEPGRALVQRAREAAGIDVPDDIRNIQEFENIIDQVAANKKIFVPNPAGKGKPVLVEDPGIDDVIKGLKIPAQDVGKLADALEMLEIQKARGINATRRQAWEERRDPAEFQREGIMFDAKGKGNVDVAIGKVGANKKGPGGRGVGALLREIEVRDKEVNPNDVRQALIGVAGGDEEPRAKFLRGQALELSPSERVERFGSEIGNAQNNMEAAVRAEAEARITPDPANPRGTSTEIAQRERALDAEFAARGRKVEVDKEALEVGEIARLMRVGAEFNGEVDLLPKRFGDGVFGAGLPEARPAGRRIEVPNESEFNQGDIARKPGGKLVFDKNGADKVFRQKGIPNRDVGMRIPENVFRSKQPIQQAPTPSIAPTPGDITGNQITPANDAGRGGWMGGNNSNARIADPWSSGGSSREMPADMRAELFKLDGPAQGPEPGRNSYRSAPDGPSSARVNRQELSNRMKRGIRGRQFGAGAAAAGGVAGLAALIGGERDQREQEQYS